MTSQEKAFLQFTEFAAKLKGDEKSEDQTFLFHLLAAFGHNWVEVTLEAAKDVAHAFNSLVFRGEDRVRARRLANYL